MKPILMTGAGGFIGANLKAHLEAQGFAVTTACSADYNFTDGKAVQKLIDAARPDIILLAGFYGIEEDKPVPQDCAEVNLKIFNNFMQAAANLPVFTFGSGAEFDKSKPIVKAKESDLGKNIPADNYGAAKFSISQKIKKYPNAYNLRLFGVYGQGEQQRRFPSYAIKQNLAGRPITMRQNVVFDYLYIKDLCAIVQQFIMRPPREQFINLTPSKSTSISQIADIINTIGPRVPVSVQKEGLANEYTGDNATLLRELPGFKFTPYEQGLKEFYDYLRRENESQK